MHEFLERLGRFSARRHWWVIGAWLVIVAVLVVLRSQFGGLFVNDYTVSGTESARGFDVLQKDFPSQGGYVGQIVFHAKTGTISDQSSVVSTAMTNVGKLPHVINATSPVGSSSAGPVSKDGTIAYGTARWDIVPASLDADYLKTLDTAVEPARKAGLQVEYGAGAGQIGQQTDDTSSEIIGLSAALILLLLMFGSIAAALVPLVSAVFSVLAGLSVVGLLAAASNVPTAAPTVATLLGLGVAVDYGLFLVARHREQVDHGMDVIESAGKATATSGGAVVVAGSTVVIAILGLYVAGVPFVGALGAASAVVVAITMVAALTIVPALMGVVGLNIRSRSDLRAAKKARAAAEDDAETPAAPTEPAHEHSAFARWGKKVSDRPWPWAITATLVLVVLAIPMFSMRLGQLDAGTNPTSESIRRAYDLVKKGFGPGANGPITIVVSLPKQSTSDDQTLVSSVQSAVSKTSGVASVSTPVTNDSNTTAVMNAIPTTSPQDAKTTDLVNKLRDTVLPPTKAKTYVMGATAGYVDFTAKIAQRMPYLILAVVLLAYVLLTIAFRSVVIATKAAILNLLSVGAAYGVIVAIFQWGWGSSLVGIEETVPIPAFVPMLIFAIVFGLSMDYEVFLLSRVHEAWIDTGDSHRSVAIGIGSTARVITTAAGIMVLVFSSFVLDIDPTVKMLAVGMAAAVLIDASVIRMVLVPAVMSVLDERAWWMPRWLDRITPHLDIEGSASGHGAAASPVSVPAESPDSEESKSAVGGG